MAERNKGEERISKNGDMLESAEDRDARINVLDAVLRLTNSQVNNTQRRLSPFTSYSNRFWRENLPLSKSFACEMSSRPYTTSTNISIQSTKYLQVATMLQKHTWTRLQTRKFTSTVTSKSKSKSKSRSKPNPKPTLLSSTTPDSTPRSNLTPSSSSTPDPKPNAVPLKSLNQSITSRLTTPSGARPLSQGAGQLPKGYQKVARQVTMAIVALPIAIVTSWFLWDRLVLGTEKKSLPKEPPMATPVVGTSTPKE